MKRSIFTLLVFVALWVASARGAVWEAIPELAQSQSYSLAWCISQAAPGDTILLLSGWHAGPITLSGELLLTCDVPGDAEIVAPDLVLSIDDFAGKIENVILFSTLTHGPGRLVEINESEVEMDWVIFRGSTLAGTSLKLVDSCNVSMYACDLSYCPRTLLIMLVDCPNDVTTSNCEWPTENSELLESVILDKNDNPALGEVIY
jgi:hypothetical protein